MQEEAVHGRSPPPGSAKGQGVRTDLGGGARIATAPSPRRRVGGRRAGLISTCSTDPVWSPGGESSPRNPAPPAQLASGPPARPLPVPFPAAGSMYLRHGESKTGVLYWLRSSFHGPDR